MFHISREAFVSLLFLNSTASAIPFVETITGLPLAPKPSPIADNSDSSFVTIETRWNNILKQRTGNDVTDSSSVTADRFDSRISAVSTFSGGAIGAELSRSRFAVQQFKSSNESQSEEVLFDQNITTGTLTFHVDGKQGVSGEISVGIPFSPDLSTESFSFTPAILTSLSQSRPVNLRGTIHYQGSRFHTGIERSHQLAVLAIGSITMTHTGHFRTIPVSISERRNSAFVGVHGDSTDLTLSGAVKTFSGESYSTGQYPLPLMIGLKLYETKFSGKFHGFSGAAEWTTGNNSFEWYDGESLKSRFIRFESNRINHGYATIGYDHTKLGGSISCETIRATMNGRGYADFYPLSAWTIFKPISYRFTEGSFLYRSVGGEIHGVKRWSDRYESAFKTGCSYATLDAEIIREKRKVMVLIPIFTGDTLMTIPQKRMIIGDISLNHSISLKRAELHFSANQLIPIVLPDPSAEDSTTTSEPESSIATATRTYGGLTLSIGITIPIRHGISSK